MTGQAGGPGRRIRVFLVDDHRVVRAGLSAYLTELADIEVAGEAASGEQALSQLAVLAPRGGLPDVVLMDLMLTGMDGIEATRAVRSRFPQVQVVAMTSFVEEDRVRAALAAGAIGYLLKDADADQVAVAVRGAVGGEVHLHPMAARAVTESIRAPRPRPVPLTPRERDVLALLAAGRSNREIARELAVSERTARTHVSNILGKLGVASRTQAALWAVREGIAPPPAAATGRPGSS